jgi:hypothetical protein
MVAAAAADPATRIALVPAATRDVAPAVPAAEAAHVSRIEIQTADPNIRIIWFAQVAVEDAEPGEYEPDR